MGSHLTWFVVLLSVAVVATLTVQVTATLSRRSRSSVVPALALGGITLVVYVLVGLLWSLEAVASLDSEVIVLLERDRKEVAGSIFAILTTFGDAIPMMTIAAGMAAVLHLRTGAWQVWLLPAVVMAEQILQVSTFNLIPALAIDDVAPEVVNGSAGTFPSGSVARMLAVFGVAGLLCDHLGIRGGWTLRAAGAVLIIEQAVSRLYLGRHLLVDVAGGLMAGLILVCAVAVVLRLTLRGSPESSRKADAASDVAG